MQELDPLSPTVHMVWIGSPKFNDGGMDVLGPETFAQNYKLFPDGSCNALVYWCQAIHKPAYEAYFAKNNVNITVSSIEDLLVEASGSSDPTCQTASKKLTEIYEEIVLNPEATIRQRVGFKDGLAYLLSYMKGDYFLDTNLKASTTQAISLPKYDRFMYPQLFEDGEKSIPEVWMRFSPQKSTIAKTCLDTWLKDISFREAISIGNVAVGALNKGIFSTQAGEINHDQPIGYWTAIHPDWQCHIEELGLSKLYFNTHYSDAKSRGAGRIHELLKKGDYTTLEFMLAHRTSIDLTTNIEEVGQKISYYNKTALQIIMEESHFDKKVALYLLEKGADPNLTYKIFDTKRYVDSEATVLTDAIKMHSIDKINFLFTHSKVPIDLNRIVNNKSILLHALEHNLDPNMFLKRHADLNQTWEGQKNTPLKFALERNNFAQAKFLINAGANPNLICNAQSPLMEALAGKKIWHVQFLLSHGADPNLIAEDSLEKLPNLYKAVLEAAKQKRSLTVEEQKTLMEEALLKNDSQSIDFLLKNGTNADISIQGETPLQIMANRMPDCKNKDDLRALSDSCSLYTTIQQLLKNGSDPNLIFRVDDGLNILERTPIMNVISKHLDATVSLFFTADCKIKVNLTSIVDNKSLLMHATMNQCGLDILLKNGADPNQIWEGQQTTPLCLALLNKDKDAVQSLLKAGADPLLTVASVTPYSIPTSPECKGILMKAIFKELTKLSPDEDSNDLNMQF